MVVGSEAVCKTAHDEGALVWVEGVKEWILNLALVEESLEKNEAAVVLGVGCIGVGSFCGSDSSTDTIQ